MAAAIGAAAAMSTSISSSSSMLSKASSSSSFIGDQKSLLLLLRPSVNLRNARRSKRRGGLAVVEAKIREIFMPALSSTMTEGKIVSWSKSEGEKLSKGESVVVVESDKADMDVETFYDGYLASIMVGEGEVAPVGAAIALLAETEDEIAEAKSKAAAPSSALSAPAEAAPEPVVATSSSPSEVPSAAVVAAPVAMPSVAIDGEKPEKRPVAATPYAKKLAKQYKLDLANITGTGPYGRIVASDVESAAGKPVTTTLQAVAASILAAPKAEKQLDGALAAGASVAPVSASGGAAAASPRADSVVPFTGMQVAVAKNMVESLSVPTFRVGYTITTTALDALYKKIKSKGVTMSALLAKATALALAQHPVVNASCKDGKSFSYNSSINIAVAVATDGGLITPVLQDADKIDIYSLSRKWKELVDKARAKQLQPQEYSTGTFTISNLGMFGVDRFDAILPPGQGAIMAIGASKPSVVASAAGLFSVKNQMQVNVTADHRIVYGADLAGFLQTLSKIIEDPKDLTL